MIQDALIEARGELASLDTRRSELEEQIRLAEAALASSSSPAPKEPEGSDATLTLHEAIAQVLREGGNEWITARALADAVNERGLYRRKRDNKPIEVNQVHARTNNYGAMFEKDGARIRLRTESPALSHHSKSVFVFRDDDEGFFDWLDANSDGYFINCERNPNPRYLVLHLSSCSHISRSPEQHWTREYVKLCAVDRGELEDWAEDALDGETTLCRSCFGGGPTRGRRPEPKVERLEASDRLGWTPGVSPSTMVET